MIEVEANDGVRVVRLAVPDRRNALSRQLIDALAVRLTNAHGGTRVTIVTGTPEYFSAGADLADLHGTGEDVDYDADVARLRDTVQSCGHPTVAAVDGYCLGAAVDLVTAFDLVVAHRHATFAVPATRLGLLYDPAALDRMAQRVSVAGLARLLLVGETIDAVQASQVGLVDIVTDQPAVDASRQVAAAIVANDDDAVDATTHVLRDIRRRQLDPPAWQAQRLALMNSPARSRALADARRPKRVAP